MFYNGYYMNSLGLILFKLLFLLDFCFKNLDLATIQLALLGFSLITFSLLLLLLLLFESALSVCFQQLKQYICMFSNVGNILILWNDLT